LRAASFSANLHRSGTGACFLIIMEDCKDAFEEWFAKSGYQEDEKNHLQNAYNYALAEGFKKGLEYANDGIFLEEK
jgi:hypothetical protein